MNAASGPEEGSSFRRRIRAVCGWALYAWFASFPLLFVVEMCFARHGLATACRYAFLATTVLFFGTLGVWMLVDAIKYWRFRFSLRSLMAIMGIEIPAKRKIRGAKAAVLFGILFHVL